MEMDEIHIAKLNLTGVVVEIQAYDMNEGIESLTQMKSEMMETQLTMMGVVLHEPSNLISPEAVLQVNAPNEEMELLTLQKNEMIPIKMMEMDETVFAILSLFTLELPQARVYELLSRFEEMEILSLEKTEMIEMLKEEMVAQTSDWLKKVMSETLTLQINDPQSEETGTLWILKNEMIITLRMEMDEVQNEKSKVTTFEMESLQFEKLMLKPHHQRVQQESVFKLYLVQVS